MFNIFLTLFVASLFLEVTQQINFNLPNVTSVHCDWTLANICSICSFASARDWWNFSGAEMKLLVCSYVLRQVAGCQLRRVNLPHTHATCSVPRQNKFNFLKASGKGCGNESEHFHHQQLSLLSALKVTLLWEGTAPADLQAWGADLAVCLPSSSGSWTQKSHGLFGIISSSQQCQMCADTWP